MPSTLKQVVDRVKTAKTDIAEAITAKGGTVASGDGLEEFAADIATIPSGSSGDKIFRLPLAGGGCRPSFNHVKAENWTAKIWNGLTDFNGEYIWTDGDNIYYSRDLTYVLDKATSTWTIKMWSGLLFFYGDNIWTDGDNIYYSNSIKQYVLNKSTSTWTRKTWNGLTDFSGQHIWTDGENIYYSSGSSQYVLDKSTSTWIPKTWNGYMVSGNNVWTDGENVYYSGGSNQYVLEITPATEGQNVPSARP